MTVAVVVVLVAVVASLISVLSQAKENIELKQLIKNSHLKLTNYFFDVQPLAGAQITLNYYLIMYFF